MTLVATTAEQPFTVAKIPVSSWTFGIRVWLAMILALFVSFWLQLAAVTVASLAEPGIHTAGSRASANLASGGLRKAGSVLAPKNPATPSRKIRVPPPAMLPSTVAR